MPWNPAQSKAACTSRIGFYHVQTDMPCQDACCISRLHDTGAIIAAVADGHGASVHDLSEYGAQLAIQAASDCCEALLKNTEDDNDATAMITHFMNKLTEQIVNRWFELVEEHAAGRDDVKKYEFDDPELLYRRYGTTLLYAVVLENMVLTAQIGDGDSLIVRPDNEIDLHHQQDDPDLMGAMTFSLASTGAAGLFKKAILPREPGGILVLGTDGLSKSFIDEGHFKDFIKNIKKTIDDHGFEKVAQSLNEWMDFLTKEGSGDDISIAIVQMHDINSTELNSNPGEHRDNLHDQPQNYHAAPGQYGGRS